jgi:hypothetical protein
MRRIGEGRMKTRKFKSVFTVTVETEVSEHLIKECLSSTWKRDHYALKTPQGVADHLAFNFAQGRGLAQLDGFAHRAMGDDDRPAWSLSQRWVVDEENSREVLEGADYSMGPKRPSKLPSKNGKSGRGRKAGRK